MALSLPAGLMGSMVSKTGRAAKAVPIGTGRAVYKGAMGLAGHGVRQIASQFPGGQALVGGVGSLMGEIGGAYSG